MLLVFFKENEEIEIWVPFYAEQTHEELYQEVLSKIPNHQNLDYKFYLPKDFPDLKYKAGLKGTKEDGVWVDEEKYIQNSTVLSNMVLNLKSAINLAIRTFNGKTYSETEWLYKSQNYQDIRFEMINKIVSGSDLSAEENEKLNYANSIINRKSKYVDICHILEDEIQQLTSISAIENYDIGARIAEEEAK